MADLEAFTLDCLPFDCIVVICEYLSAEDLARMSRVCSLFHEATQVGYLWRRLSLSRWTFCNLHQISAGAQRWRRYFVARRCVEARMETGRPLRDYRVRTLRGHESDIVSVEVMGGRGGRGEDVNWENPSPPFVISLSSDGTVKAWDVMQGKAVGSLEGEDISCLAARDSRGEVALGRPDGRVQLWGVGEWTLRSTFHTSGGGCGAVLQYGSVGTKRESGGLPQIFLMVHTQNGQLELWDPEAVVTSPDKQATDPVKPVLQLWAPSHVTHCHLSSYGLLCLVAGFGEVYVFDLPSLSPSDPRPLPPHITLHTSNIVISSCWVEPRCLATVTQSTLHIELWDVGSHFDKLTKGRRSLYDDTNMYSPVRTIQNRIPPLCMGVANDLLITGDDGGHLRLIDPRNGNELQKFHNHKAKITDIYADRFRVLSCSSDFSIRVYRWLRATHTGQPAQLEDRYTLLGGSVALKKHDGFNRLLCEASSCVGVAGNQLKFYTFSTNLEPAAS